MLGDDGDYIKRGAAVDGLGTETGDDRRSFLFGSDDISIGSGDVLLDRISSAGASSLSETVMGSPSQFGSVRMGGYVDGDDDCEKPGTGWSETKLSGWEVDDLGPGQKVTGWTADKETDFVCVWKTKTGNQLKATRTCTDGTKEDAVDVISPAQIKDDDLKDGEGNAVFTSKCGATSPKAANGEDHASEQPASPPAPAPPAGAEDCSAQWSDWDEQGRCSGGIHTRHWEVTQQPKNGGQSCAEKYPDRIEGQPSVAPCGTNCTASWAEWGECGDVLVGLHLRKWKITTPARDGGYCEHDSTYQEYQVCDRDATSTTSTSTTQQPAIQGLGLSGLSQKCFSPPPDTQVICGDNSSMASVCSGKLYVEGDGISVNGKHVDAGDYNCSRSGAKCKCVPVEPPSTAKDARARAPTTRTASSKSSKTAEKPATTTKASTTTEKSTTTTKASTTSTTTTKASTTSTTTSTAASTSLTPGPGAPSNTNPTPVAGDRRRPQETAATSETVEEQKSDLDSCC